MSDGTHDAALVAPAVVQHLFAMPPLTGTGQLSSAPVSSR